MVDAPGNLFIKIIWIFFTKLKNISGQYFELVIMKIEIMFSKNIPSIYKYTYLVSFKETSAPT
jgi:hypothetical protein